MKAKVYFSRTITPEKVLELYKTLGKQLPGKVAIKLHSGETGNQNFLKPEFWKPVIDHIGGTVVECNTAYEGTRDTTEKHLKTMEEHGWSKYFEVDLLDAEGPDKELAIPKGRKIQKNFVGKNIEKYDSMLILSHFKGHPMGGFGGGIGGSHEELCGAVSGGVLVLSLANPHQDGGDTEGKKAVYAKAKEFRQRFTEVFGGLSRCGELLRARPGISEAASAASRLHITSHCDIMIVTAVEIVEDMLQNPT